MIPSPKRNYENNVRLIASHSRPYLIKYVQSNCSVYTYLQIGFFFTVSRLAILEHFLCNLGLSELVNILRVRGVQAFHC